MTSPTSCAARTFQVYDKGMSRRKTGQECMGHTDRWKWAGCWSLQRSLGNVSFQEERKADSGIPGVR